MRLLLDTHTLLWFYSGDEALSNNLRETIKSPANACFISIASLWEITIKVSLGKLELNTSILELFDFLERNQFWVLPIEFNHLVELQRLPNHHRDPFDRLIIAQALAENLAVATRDSFFSQYGLTITW
ncbi:type II toxin-antitoxin system VapC family toxin [Spirosoma pollinicola]|uniref:PIN domain nuclease n=1 Tax=Spirosoma pollinicola TaxID=2057025 RepID=A0A2K8YS59_9BACT|nr:type II toxin-antitoxin system VapC family toxin [Spirosoma pollinicola]AUD00456.1 PIN domain nuclease [Spirosoma pollinicola]